MQNKLKGHSPNIINEMFDAAMESCMKQINEHPEMELEIMYDLESGFPFVCSKEYKETFIKMWEETKPKADYVPSGKIIMFGTGGDIDNGSKDFKNYFK